MGPAAWGPPVLWMGFILWLSSDTWSASHTSALLLPLLRWLLPWASSAQLAALHAVIRKLAHLSEYAILALLWYRAFARAHFRPARAAWRALAISIGWAGVDEARQALTASRTASGFDVAIDSAGAALALASTRVGQALRSRWRDAR